MKAIALCALAVALLGATAAPRSKDITIVVNGESVISRAPDVATVSFGIVTINDIEQNTTSENNQRYEDLRTRMHSLGIPDSSIRTVSFNVNYVAPEPQLPTNERPRSGYTVSRQVEVKTTNLDSVGSIIDQAVAANVSDVNSVSYTVSNERQIYAEALGSAVTDAQRQAKAMASAANLRVLRIAAMQSGYTVQPVIMRAAPMRREGGPPPVPTQISPSNIDVHANVTVTYVVGP
ncbi:MAG: SIMPL domain-containing protein [Candidatus Eremiobacteraeota bacterium]|nr:SIMPL domain-containing protein [Candidatus Eremiobacteraeota bacterium]